MNGIAPKPHDTFEVGEKLGHAVDCWCLEGEQPRAIAERTPLEASLTKETDGPEHGSGPESLTEKLDREIREHYARTVLGRRPGSAPGDPLPMDRSPAQRKGTNTHKSYASGEWYVEG